MNKLSIDNLKRGMGGTLQIMLYCSVENITNEKQVWEIVVMTRKKEMVI